MFNCEYCDNNFSSKSALNSHQKKTKYCLEIQQKSNPDINIGNIFCQYCNRTFTRKHTNDKHESICKNNSANSTDFLLKQLNEKNIEINLLKNEIIVLNTKLENETKRGDLFEKLHNRAEGCVEKIALQPKNSTTTTTNTLNIPNFNTTLEQLTLAATDKFDENLFLQGQIGAAKFFLDHVKLFHNGELPWIVSDKSREILKFKDDKEVITDPKAKRLAQLVSDAIKIKNQEHYDNIYRTIKEIDDRDNLGSGDETEEDGLSCHDIRENQADKCYVELKRLTKDNKVFRKRIIEETFK